MVSPPAAIVREMQTTRNLMPYLLGPVGDAHNMQPCRSPQRAAALSALSMTELWGRYQSLRCTPRDSRPHAQGERTTRSLAGLSISINVWISCYEKGPHCEDAGGESRLGAMQSVTILLKRVRPASDPLPLPKYMTAGAAGMDLMADLPEPVELAPGARALIPSGISVEIPAGFEAQIRPRSGLALRHGVTLLNSPGSIDADYRGEIMVLMIKRGQQSYVVHRAERIAQMIVAPVTRAELREVDTLAQSGRGTGGFAHTDVGC